MARGGNTHDISITDTDDIGFMLARDRYGKPIYSESMANPLTLLQGVEGMSEDALDPQREFPVGVQTSWVGGFGQYFFDRANPRRYYASYGVDASQDGQLKLGPAWTTITWPTVTTYSVTDAGLETWTSSSNLTNWTESSNDSNGTVAQNAATVHGGTYSALLTAHTDVNDWVMVAQKVKDDLATTSSDMRGKKFRATVWVNQTVASRTAVRIFDGVGRTTGDTSATTGSFVQLSVERTLSATATELTVELFASDGGGGSAAFFDDVTLVGYTKNASYHCYAEYGNLQYVSIGDILYQANLATAPTSWQYVDNYYGDNITCLHPATRSADGTAYLFVMVGPGNTTFTRGYYYDGSTSTAMTDGGGTDSSGEFMASVSSSSVTTLWVSSRPTGVTTGNRYIVRSNDFDTAMTDAWSSDTVVGDSNTNITGLCVVNNLLYIAKEDALWKMAADGTVSMVVDYRMMYKTTSGKGITGWQNKVYVPAGVNSLIEYDPDSGEYADISPARSLASIKQSDIVTAASVTSTVAGDFDGQIVRVAGGDEFLWLIQDNGNQVNLFKGKYAVVDSIGWIWHPLANTTMVDPNAMAVSALTGSPLVWAIPASTTTNPGYYNLATYETADATYTKPCLITPYYTGNVRSIMKEVYRTILGLESITSTVYITLQYRFYGTSSWSDALTYDGAAGTVTNGEDSNYMPANSYGTGIQFRINFVSGSSASTPKVTYLKAYGKIKANEIPIIQCRVIACDNGITRRGARDGYRASRKKTALDNSVASNWPVTLYDLSGTSRSVDMISRTQADVLIDERGRLSYTYDLVMQKVTLS